MTVIAVCSMSKDGAREDRSASKTKDELFPGLKQRYSKCSLEHDFATPFTPAEGRGAEVSGRTGMRTHGGDTMD